MIFANMIKQNPNEIINYPFETKIKDKSRNRLDLTEVGTLPLSTSYPMPAGKNCVGPFSDSNYGTFSTAIHALINGDGFYTECFAYFNDLSNNPMIVNQFIDTTGGRDWYIIIQADGAVRAQCNFVAITTSAGLITTGSWFYIALFTHSGNLANSTKLYISPANNISKEPAAMGNFNRDIVNTNSGRLSSYNFSAGRGIDGYIKNFRILKGMPVTIPAPF